MNVKHLAGLSLLTLVAAQAHAADPQDSALTLTPWSGTALQFTDEDARFSGAFSANLGRGLWGQAEMSVPLNPVDDQAVLVDSSGAVSGFTARAALGWDSTYRLLAVVETEDLLARMAFCQRYGLVDCTDSNIKAQVARLEAELSDFHNIRPSVEVGRHYSAALEIGGSYGGVAAISDPTARERQVYHDFAFEVGPRGTVFWQQAILSFNPGVGVQQEVRVDTVTSCVNESAADDHVVQVCYDDLLVSEDPSVQLSAHLRTAVTFWDTDSRLSGDLAPGVEVRTNLEQLFTGAPTLNMRLTGFLGPKAWPLGLRSGIGVDVDVSLSGQDRVLQKVTPFAFIGATFDSVRGGAVEPAPEG